MFVDPQMLRSHMFNLRVAWSSGVWRWLPGGETILVLFFCGEGVPPLRVVGILPAIRGPEALATQKSPPQGLRP
jgi:hypothetical protein